MWTVLAGLATGLWWLATRVGAPALLALGWATYVWLSGRTWRHHVQRRLVRREVRAAGNWALTIALAALLWQPVATAAVLALAGGSLVTTALVARHRAGRALPAGSGPIRVRATPGPPRRLTTSREGR